MAKWSTLFPSGPGNIDGLSTGIIAKTVDGVIDTYVNRTITGTSNRITVTDGDGVAGNPTLDIGSDVTTVNNTQTFTGVKTFGTTGNVGKFKLAGSTSGSSTLDAPAVAGSTAFSLPITSGTLIGTGDTATVSNAMLANSAVANLSGTNTGDNAVNSNYSGLVSNATHTGDATGATALTVVAINGTNMAALGTGILKNTTSTGVPSIAIAGDFPILNQNTTGNAATVTTNANLTGPVTSVGNTTSIANGAISNAMLANSAVANLSGTNTGDQTSVTGNSGSTDALKSATTTINVSSATAPTNGQVLTATSSTAATWQTPSGGFSDPMTTRGDIIYRNASNVTARLGVGTNTYVLTSDGTDVSWAAPSGGGMTNPMTTGGDVIYGGAAGTPTRLANGANGQVLTSSGGTSAPTWQTPSGGGGGTSGLETNFLLMGA